MDRIRIGMIGVGQIGKHHIRNYRQIAGVELVAAADVDKGELGRVAGEFGIPDTYADYHELLRRDDIDAVDVCLHNKLHAPVTVDALEAGKHVYCEKPIAGSYAEGLRMVEAAKATGQKIHIQLSTLYSMEARAAQRLIKADMLGHIYHARSCGYRRRGRPFVDGYGTANFVQKEVAAGGALFDMGIYHIAQLVYLLGLPKPVRISGKTYQETEMDEGRRRKSGYDVEELAVGFVRFEDGLTMDIIESWAVHMGPFGGSCILGSKGGVGLDPFIYYNTTCDMLASSTFDLKNAQGRVRDLYPDEAAAYESSQHHWIAALQERVDLIPTAEIALLTMQIQEGMYLSDELGREVGAEEVPAK